MIYLLIYAIGVAYSSYLIDTSLEVDTIDVNNPNDGFWTMVIFETIFCYTSWLFVFALLLGKGMKGNS